MEATLEARDITKHFSSTVALDNVSISIYPGEIRGLIGENGSGKSTLSSIIAGILQPSSGSMIRNGKAYEPATALDGQRNGIGMIVQEAGTVSRVSVAENIFLGRASEFSTFGFVSKKKMVQQANSALRSIGVNDIDAGDSIDNLDMQDRKLVEIAKVMEQNPQILIVDESTTALSQVGRELLYGIMQRMKDEGKSVLFISHDLDELMQICDKLTVLRDGKHIADLDKSEFEDSRIKQLMVGREMKGDYYPVYTGVPSGETVLEAKNLYTYGVLNNVSLHLKKGEILGIGGLSHCGMHELGRLLFGLDKPLLGHVFYSKTGEVLKTPSQAMELGMGYISKNRDTESLVLEASLRDNIAITGLDVFDKKPLGIVLGKDEKAYVQKQVDALSIKCESIDQYTTYLSGGNKQKVVFGKWIGRNADILILDCPTRGVDVGVKAAMYALMNDMRLAGKSIIMISEELPELIGMCDRLIIMMNGKITAEIDDNAKMTESVLIEHMI